MISSTYEEEKAEIPVSIMLDDGITSKGYLRTRKGKALIDLLNSSEQFFDFVNKKGTCIFVAKTSIKKIIELEDIHEKVEEDDISSGESDMSEKLKNIDPFATLEIAKTASAADIQTAYHKKLKAYHPDRFSQMDLPSEVEEYLLQMTQKLNAAYTKLSD